MLHRRKFLAASAGFSMVSLIPGAAKAELRRLPVELVSEIDGLKGKVVLGSQSPDVTLYEFFDYNCGYCRQSALEVSGLLQGDANLRYVLVNFAVLSPDSILAHRVALAFLKQKPDQYLAFHQQLFEKRGIRSGAEALDVAVLLGGNEKALIAESNQKATTNALIKAVQLGDNLGLSATPSYIAGAEGNVGFLDIDQKRAMIADLRKCEKMSCG
jgi:protein-disulfide isomerase